MALDLLLINPPSRGSYGFLEKARDCCPPLGLGYIAAYAEDKGHTVEIYDMDVEPVTLGDIQERLARSRPAVVGLTTTTPTMAPVIEIAALVKRHAPETLLIAGGAHVSVLPEESLRRSEIDIVVRGEGEVTTEEILSRRDRPGETEATTGISFRRGGHVIHNPDRELFQPLDALPFPARHLLPMDRYRTNNYLEAYGNRFTSIMASRGCPYHCKFCGHDTIFKHLLRKRNPVRVVDEIDEVRGRYGVDVFMFDDSTFTVNPDLVEGICREVLARRLKIKWGCMGRANLADERLYRIMKQAGCVLIFYGVESGDPDILKWLRKEITPDMVRRAVKVVKAVGIPVNTSFILGLPGETKETIERTIRFVLELDPDYATFSLATPYPGTEFHDFAVAQHLDFSDWTKFAAARYADPLYIPKGLTAEEMKRSHRLAYRRFYMRPAYLWRSLFKIKSFGDLAHKVQVAKSFLR